MLELRKIYCFPLCWCSALAWADEAVHDYRTQSSPTMARFYTVEDNGRSVRDVVEVAVIADPDARPSRVIVTGRSRVKKKAEPAKDRRVSLKVSVESVYRDSFAEFRCERYGFYYTSNGDCVVPAWSFRSTVKKNTLGLLAAPVKN